MLLYSFWYHSASRRFRSENNAAHTLNTLTTEIHISFNLFVTILLPKRYNYIFLNLLSEFYIAYREVVT